MPGVYLSVMLYLRVILIVLWLLITFGIGTLLAVLTLGGSSWDRYAGRVFSRGVFWLTGIRVELLGGEHLEAHQPCIYVANHQSMLDVVTFGSVFPHRAVVIAKKEVMWIPIFGLFFLVARNISIDRKRRVRAIVGLERAIKAMHDENISIWIFPEGTRNRAGAGLLPFKKGAFHMAMRAKVPIVPVVSSSLLPVWNWRERKLRRGRVIIQALPPIDPGKFAETNLEGFANEARNQMLDALAKLNLRVQSPIR